MARPIRVQYEGAVYHVAARGNERREIFRGDPDREMFLETLGEAVARFGLTMRAWCLMPNHYHLILETPMGNLSRGVGWLQTTYTIRFNRRHRRCGHLFQGRYKAHLVDGEAYGTTLLRYVHLNPVRPRDRRRPVPAEKRGELDSYPWSSHRDYAGLRRVGPVATDLGWLGFFGRGAARRHRGYREFIGDAFGSAIESPWDGLRAGLVLGSEALMEKAQEMLRDATGQEEARWARARSWEARARALAGVLADEEDERVRVWARVRLAAERPVDIAREKGLRDGGSVLQILKRTEARAASDPVLRARLARIETALSRVES